MQPSPHTLMTDGTPSNAARRLRSELTASPLHTVLAESPDAPYSEETFCYFLDVERKRVERSRRPLLLLLVRLRAEPGADGRMDEAVAGALFAGLRLCTREVDFVGWYRRGRVAAAVLTQAAEVPPVACARIRERAVETLTRRLPSRAARRLHVRILHVRPRNQD